MEINVTKLITQNDYSMRDFSASYMELGEDVGRITWNACVEAAEDYKFIDDSNYREWKEFIVSTGGWTWDDINNWNDSDFNAIFIQFVAGDYRNDYEGDVDEDNRSGRLYQGDCGDWFYYVGN